MNQFVVLLSFFIKKMDEMSKKVVVLQPFEKHFISLWRYFIIVVV
jgi:hypothetical protein